MSKTKEQIKNGSPKIEAESPYMKQRKKFNLWRGIYNKDKNYILGRTPKNWGKLNFIVIFSS